MNLVTPLQVFVVGLAGGGILELLHWYNLRREPEYPTYGKEPKYWIITALMAAAGGGLAVLYFGGRADGIVAFHVGVSTPLILQKLATTIASTPGARGSGPSVVTFFRW
jgi:hypothetical protein